MRAWIFSLIYSRGYKAKGTNRSLSDTKGYIKVPMKKFAEKVPMGNHEHVSKVISMMCLDKHPE